MAKEDLVEARVLLDTLGWSVDEIVKITKEEAMTLAGIVDTTPESVSYAKSLSA